MNTCYADGDFGKYFRENMDALGLPTPTSMFDTYSSAVANASLMAARHTSLAPRPPPVPVGDRDRAPFRRSFGMAA